MGTPQPSPNPASSPVLDPEEAILRRLGYVQVLYREMGGFSNFAISFTIISILAGCLTSYYIAFNNGGPVAITWGFFCGTASLTAASRMLFAFSRDRAVPGWRLWRTVAANRVPVNAVAAIAVLAWAMMLPTLINGAIGYLVGTSIAVIGLYVAFVLPILLRIRVGEQFECGAWNLGRHYKWIAPLAVGWIAVICVLFLLPVSPKGIPGAPDFDWNVVNYAPLTVGAAVLLFGGWYLLSARHWFVGPIPDARLDDGLRWGNPSPPPSPTRSPELFSTD